VWLDSPSLVFYYDAEDLFPGILTVIKNKIIKFNKTNQNSGSGHQ